MKLTFTSFFGAVVKLSGTTSLSMKAFSTSADVYDSLKAAIIININAVLITFFIFSVYRENLLKRDNVR